MKQSGIALIRSTLLNPFAIGIISQSTVLLIYSLNWSSLYPPIPAAYYYWLSAYIAIALVFSKTFKASPMTSRRSIPVLGATNLFILSISLLCIDILFSGLPPIVQLIFGGYSFTKSAILDYGVPIIHPVLLSSAILVFVISIDTLVSSKIQRLRFVCFAIVSLGIMSAMLSRGTLSIAILAVVFSSIRWKGNLKMYYLISTAVIVLLFVVFGAVGDFRTGGSKEILILAGATTKFIESSIPNFLFWIYIYAASPLANFCLNLTAYPYIDQLFPGEFFVRSFVPDLIVKRISFGFDHVTRNDLLISPALTVSGSLCAPYLSMGWIGVLIKTIYDFSLVAFLLKYAKRSSWVYPHLHSILIVAIALSVFDDMTTFSGILIPCVLLLLVPNKKLSLHFPVAKQRSMGASYEG